jgi:hypothetical protein
MPVDLDVIVDVDAGFFPFGERVGHGGQGPQGRSLPGCEQRLPRAGLLLERPLVEPPQQVPNRLVEFGQREALSVAQGRHNPAFDHLDPDFDLRLVAGFLDASREDRHAVRRGQLGVRGVEVRLVAMGAGHPAVQVIGDEDRADPPEKGERPHVRADPVRQPPGPGRLGAGVVRGAQHGDKDVGRANLAGAPIDHRGGLAGVVDKRFLAEPMGLAHDPVQGPGPSPVLLAEPAVLEPVRMGELVLLPEQRQRDPLALQLLMDHRPIRQRPAPTRRPRRRRKPPPFQVRIAEIGRQRPGQPRFVKAAQTGADGAARQVRAPGNLPGGQPGFPGQPEDFANFPHG